MQGNTLIFCINALLTGACIHTNYLKHLSYCIGNRDSCTYKNQFAREDMPLNNLAALITIGKTEHANHAPNKPAEFAFALDNKAQ